MSGHLSLSLPDPGATCRLAEMLGARLGPGDVILLEGPIGAGKSHFARCLIRSVLLQPEDIPSPTFTLVQVYDTRAGELWHSDLYRLGGPAQVEETGLTEAFGTAICLVEWPDRLGTLAPGGALTLRLDPRPGQPEARRAELLWQDAGWDDRLRDLPTWN